MLSVHIYRIFWVSTRQPTIVLPSTRQPTIVGATSCLWFMRCMLGGRCTYYKSMRPAFCNFMNCKERARRRRTNCATLSLTYPLLRCVVCSLRLHGLHTLYTVNLFLGGVVCSLRNMRLNPYEPQRGCATHMCTIHYYRVSYAFGDAPTCKTGATPYAQMIPFLWCVGRCLYIQHVAQRQPHIHRNKKLRSRHPAILTLPLWPVQHCSRVYPRDTRPCNSVD